MIQAKGWNVPAEDRREQLSTILKIKENRKNEETICS